MKRRLLTLALFLLLGAVVNVAVAWALAMSVDVGLTHYDASAGIVSSDETLGVSTHSSFGASLVYVHHSRNERTRESQIFGGDPHELLPSWGDLDLVPSEDYTEGRASIDNQALNSYGLPMLAMWYRYRINPRIRPTAPLTYSVRGGILVASYHIGGPGGEPGILPIRLIFPGFAINTILYAAILWPLWRIPFALRRHIRRKRGLCVTCGYDLSGDLAGGCPECGWRREGDG